MADVNQVLQTVAGGKKATAALSVSQILSQDSVKKRFEDMLGRQAASFISSVISLSSMDKNLAACDPKSVVSAAALAATLNLPVNKSLGFAWVIPYKGKAEFQMGYKGFVQLAIRTGQYKTMNASEIYADEIKYWNPITGVVEFTPMETWKQREAAETKKIVGYVSFFKLNNGFEKYLYMTNAQIDAHAKRYAQSYSNPNGKWKTDRDAMAKKTVLKLILSKYGVLSIEMQRAMAADQGVVKDFDSASNKDADPTVEFTDAVVVDEVPADSGTAIEPTETK